MGVLSRFKNIGKTLGGIGQDVFQAIPDLGAGSLGKPIHEHFQSVSRGQNPFSPGLPSLEEEEDLRFTGSRGTDIAEQIRLYVMTTGLDQLTQTVAEQMKAGIPITPEQMATLVEGTAYIGSLYNGTADLGAPAGLQLLQFISDAAEGDYSTTSFAVGLAQQGANLSLTDTPEDDAFTQSALEEQRLRLEQQRIETLMAQRNYEREGILSIIQMLPSANRLQFMSAMFQTPKFAQLFFGDFDAGSNEGPYVGGVIGSLGAGSSTAPQPVLGRTDVVSGTKYTPLPFGGR